MTNWGRLRTNTVYPSLDVIRTFVCHEMGSGTLSSKGGLFSYRRRIKPGLLANVLMGLGNRGK